VRPHPIDTERAVAAIIDRVKEWSTGDILFVVIGMLLLLTLGALRHRIGELIGTLIGKMIGRRAVRHYLARSRALDPWRAELKAGDRCWVIGPMGEATRMTLHSRSERDVDLITHVDPLEGVRCWMGVSVERLFPDKPTDRELEIFEILERERLLSAKTRPE
jgi:hypothetical protein